MKWAFIFCRFLSLGLRAFHVVTLFVKSPFFFWSSNWAIVYGTSATTAWMNSSSNLKTCSQLVRWDSTAGPTAVLPPPSLWAFSSRIGVAIPTK